MLWFGSQDAELVICRRARTARFALLTKVLSRGFGAQNIQDAQQGCDTDGDDQQGVKKVAHLYSVEIFNVSKMCTSPCLSQRTPIVFEDGLVAG